MVKALFHLILSEDLYTVFCALGFITNEVSVRRKTLLHFKLEKKTKV